MTFFTDAARTLIAADPSRIDALYANWETSFRSALGTAFASQPEDHIRLAFCGVLAYELKPYGASTALTLNDLLAASQLDCDNYVMLAWQLYDLLNPQALAHVAMIGWNGEPVSNHAQLLVSTPGSESLLVDPTIAHLAVVSGFSGLVAGEAIADSQQASFYSRPELDSFRQNTIGAVTDGLFGLGNLLYWFESPDQYIRFGQASLNWPTPQAEFVNGTGMESLAPDLSAAAGSSIVATAVPGGFFSSAQLNAVLHQPSDVAAIYGQYREAFVARMGPSFASLPEDYLKLAFSAVVAHELKPYGSSNALSFDDILDAVAITTDKYSLLTWNLYRFLSPSATSDVDMIAWNGDATGLRSHLLISEPGARAMLVDTAVAHFALTEDIDTLVSGLGVPANDQASFYARSDLDWAQARLVTALDHGLIRAGNLLYWFDDPDEYAISSVPWEGIPTPQAALIGDPRPLSGIDILLSYLPAETSLTVTSGVDTILSTGTRILPDGADNLTLLGVLSIDGVGNDLANVIRGNSGANRLYGGSANDRIYGNEGDDLLFGGPGNDILNGVSGSDWMEGGSGNDRYYVNVAGDTAFERSGQGTDTVLVYMSNYALGSALENLVLLGNAVSGTGNSAGNNITGDQLNNVLDGKEGNDRLDGGGGTDLLIGGPGNDTYVMADLIDQIVELPGEGFDTLQSSLSYQLPNAIEKLILTGFGNVSGLGNVLDDIIMGNAGVNAINGGLGNDTLSGGGGKDLLTGSGGLDRFDFTALTDSGVSFSVRDVINTFAHGDKVNLSQIDANASLPGDQAFSLTSQLTGVAGQLTYVKTTSTGFYITADVSGDATADFSLQIYGAPGVTQLYSWDFLL